jgi:hypothetical protein
MGVVERGEYNFTLKTVYKPAKGLDTSVSALLRGILRQAAGQENPDNALAAIE